MSFPHGYRVMVDVGLASLTELAEIARTSVDPIIRLNADHHARLWKNCAAQGGMPWIITRAQPDGHYTGWVLTPSEDVEFYDNGVRRLTKRTHYEARYPIAHGLEGDAVEERRP